jgi:hypothetical protein
MPITSSRASIRGLAAILLALVVGLSTAEAAEKMRWDELQRRLGHRLTLPNSGTLWLENRGFAVVTKAGAQFRGRAMNVTPLSLEIWGSGLPRQTISREDVARIIIRQKGRYLHHLNHAVTVAPETTDFALSDAATPLLLFFIPPVWAVAVGSTPFLPTAEGISRLFTARVIEIIQ